MNLKIRQEQEDGYELVEGVVKFAFAHAEYSDKQEHKLISRIRKSNTFIPELSLVATDQYNDILGHILLSKIKISNDDQITESLALAPVSVLPKYQKRQFGDFLLLLLNYKPNLLLC